MDASALRWALAVIGIVLLVGIYLFGLQQNRLRKRAAKETFSRDEIDSAFIEDQQLREELDKFGEIISTDEEKVNLGEISINPAMEADPSASKPEPLFIADAVAEIDSEKLISHLLMDADYRLLTGEEIQSALSYTGLERDTAGLLEYRDADKHCFSIASLSAPGHFSDLESAEFTTLGLNCFINIEIDENVFKNYEIMLKKIDELVRLLNFKVYQSNQQLLTISDVTEIRNKLSP